MKHINIDLSKITEDESSIQNNTNFNNSNSRDNPELNKEQDLATKNEKEREKEQINYSYKIYSNAKVKKENKLPEEINNYLVKIRGKEDNIKFLENNFIDNYTFFGKGSAQYQSILETIERIYQNQAQNEEAIELLEKPTQNFISEIMSNKEMRQKFFEEDREMKIKEVKNDKCRIIANSLKDKKSLKGQPKDSTSKPKPSPNPQETPK